MNKLRQGKRRIMKEFRFDELAAVDLPAQEGASAVLMKRAEGKGGKTKKQKKGDPGYVAKRGMQLATGVMEGHAHGVNIDFFDDCAPHIWVSHSVSEGAEISHDHAAVLNADGSISILMNDGHDHTVEREAVIAVLMATQLEKSEREALTKIFESDEELVALLKAGGNPGAPQEAAMPTPEETANLDKLVKRAERAEAISALPAEQYTYLKSLGEPELEDAFLAQDAETRATEVADAAKRAEDSDPVVYKANDGTEFRKSDGDKLVQLAKDRDEDRKELAKARAVADEAVLAKRVEDEIPNLPGDGTVKSAILKALDTIKDEDVRKKAHEAIQAGSKAITAAFEKVGRTAQPDETVAKSAEDELETLAKARAAEKDESYVDAYDAVTKENPELARKAITGN